MSQEVYCISYPLPDTATGWQGNSVIGHVFKAPAAADGGGIKILRAYVVNAAATTSGTAFTLTLYNYGTAGTSAEGTIGAVGGTADPLGASEPKAFTLTAAQTLIDAGEWIVLGKAETNSSDPTRGVVVIEYQMGN